MFYDCWLDISLTNQSLLVKYVLIDVVAESNDELMLPNWLFRFEMPAQPEVESPVIAASNVMYIAHLILSTDSFILGSEVKATTLTAATAALNIAAKMATARSSDFLYGYLL
jgi:hypothetical protein